MDFTRFLHGAAVTDPKAQVIVTAAPDPPTTTEQVLNLLRDWQNWLDTRPFVVVHPDTKQLELLETACAAYGIELLHNEYVDVDRVYIIEPDRMAISPRLV